MLIAVTERQHRAMFDLQCMVLEALGNLNPNNGHSDAAMLDGARSELCEIYNEVMEMLGPMLEPTLN